MKKYTRRIYTSFVSPLNLDAFIKDNILPIIIIRNIRNSKVIGQFSNTSFHFKELAPSTELFRSLRDGQIERDGFNKRYVIEMASVNLFETLRKINYLGDLCSASGIVLLGYGSDRDKCHRSLLGDLLENTGLLEHPIKEIIP